MLNYLMLHCLMLQFLILHYINISLCDVALLSFEIRSSSARVFSKSKTTRVKHNCASVCNIVKERIAKAWFINETKG